MTKSNSKKIAVGFSFLLVIGLALYLSQKNDSVISDIANENEAVVRQDEIMSTTTLFNATSVPISSSYKNGIYSANAVYNSPAGSENIQVSVTLENDMVTSATFSGDAKNPTSKNKQSQFASAFKSKVVGKNINEIELTVIGGASLTTKAFMDALAKIESEAKD